MREAAFASRELDLGRAGVSSVTAWLRPSDDVEVSDVMPEIVDSCRSIGEATDAAMVSGLAPGSCAVISMVGKSTFGNAETGNSR